MKKTSKILAMALCLVLCMSLFAVTAFAETAEVDGLKLTLTTDKAEYALGEEIAATVKIENLSPAAASNVALKLEAPAILQLVSGEASKNIASLAAGASESVVITYKTEAPAPVDPPVENPENPGTGDNAFLVIGAAIASCAVVVLLFVNRKTACMALAILMLAGVCLPAAAATEPKALEASVTIKVGEEQVTLKASASLDLEIPEEEIKPLLGSSDGTFTENEDGTITTTNEGFALATFNLPASKQYYVEAVYTYSGDVNGSVLAGLRHVDPNDDSKMIEANIDRGDRNVNHGWFYTSGEGSWYVDTYLRAWRWRIVEYGGQSDPNAKVVKVAIARNGDQFHFFVNDQHVSTVTYTEWSDVDTIPGIFAHNPSTATISDVVLLSGDKAMAKLNDVTANGAGFIAAYSPFDWSMNSRNDGNYNFTVNEVSEERGINFDFTNLNAAGYNDGMVTPYLYLDGDFTFSWEYKNTGTRNEENTSRMLLEMRPIDWYAETSIVFGSEFSNNARSFCNTPNLEQQWWEKNHSELDASQGLRYTLKRKLEADKAVVTMRIESIANPEQVLERVVELYPGISNQNFDEKWAEPVILLWHNVGVTGEYSNITWSTEA